MACPTEAGAAEMLACPAEAASEAGDCEGWRKPVGVEPTLPALRGKRPVLKTGKATGPRRLPGESLTLLLYWIAQPEGACIEFI